MLIGYTPNIPFFNRKLNIAVAASIYGVLVFTCIFLTHTIFQKHSQPSQLSSDNLTYVEKSFEIITTILFFPIFETLLFQFLPFKTCSYFKLHISIKIIASIALFAFAHTTSGLQIFIINGLGGGLLLAFSYAFWAKINIKTAIAATTLTHFIHNSITVVLLTTIGT